MSITMPPNQPVNGSISVEGLLKDPTVLQATVFPADRQFMSEYVYRGPVANDSGQIEYEIARMEADRAARGRARRIEPGTQYPTIDVALNEIRRAGTQKWGTSYPVTYEAVRRNKRDVITEGNRTLATELVIADENLAIAALTAAADEFERTSPATGSWGTDKNILKDVGNSLATVDSGVEFDTLIINPLDAWAAAQTDSLQKAVNPTGRAEAPIYNNVFSPIQGLYGLDVVTRRSVPRGTAYLVQRGRVGQVVVEQDFSLRVDDDVLTDRYVVKASRWFLPVVTTPQALQVITGI